MKRATAARKRAAVKRMAVKRAAVKRAAVKRAAMKRTAVKRVVVKRAGRKRAARKRAGKKAAMKGATKKRVLRKPSIPMFCSQVGRHPWLASLGSKPLAFTSVVTCLDSVKTMKRITSTFLRRSGSIAGPTMLLVWNVFT